MVSAVGGALFGTAVAFLFPTLMFLKAVEQAQGAAARREAYFCLSLMCLGIVLGATGVATAG